MEWGATRPRPKKRDNIFANFAQIIHLEFMKVIHAATKQSHKHKKCHMNDLESGNDSDCRS